MSLSPVKQALVAVRELKARVEELERTRTEPIAVIGMGCRFPGRVDGPREFWQLLRAGVDAVTAVPADRWDADAYFDADPSTPDRMTTRWGAFLNKVDCFDAAFFGISPREASAMDPQQRLLLEVACDALEDAGQDLHRLAGSPVGVFVGMYNTDYAQLQTAGGGVQDVYSALGSSPGVASGRLSFALDLQGPSLVVDTLCSSSLVAVHLAIQSLRNRGSDLALAGGVNLILSPLSTMLTSKLMALAPDGRCKTFDARANGFVRGEGCGIVVLKRLADAVRDADPIWAVIRGSAVNQDGRSSGLTAPNVLAQRSLIRQALADAGLAPSQIGYIEAHGTGTPLGDPIEVEALASVYGEARPDGDVCALGAVKTNLGHLEAAAGVASLMKAVLALKYAAIPPHLHFQHLNPRISLDGVSFCIPTTLQPWAGSTERRRCAAVSAFGISGTNAHLILEEAPPAVAELVAPPHADAALFVLPLSARSPAALRALAEAYANLLARTDAPSLHDVCYTASRRRTHHDYRRAIVGTSPAELV
ncbi:MAG TPA: beta-ketoacyl synthase N-terminal-like domain-containing protein, partial [Chloroflexota bacterium]